MIVESLMDFEPINAFVRIKNVIRDDVRVYLKTEMFNPGGSIKFKPAVGIIRALEARGELGTGKSIIDTTSGNMGIALSLIAKHRGYRFICVSDDKVTRHNRLLMEAYGAVLVILPKSTLRERFSYIEKRVAEDSSLVWTRQFSNEVNPCTHESTTANEIMTAFARFDYVFCGTGTSGTLVGSGRAFRRERPDVRLIAVDAEGSQHFDSKTGDARRLLPGIGASERSRFLDDVELHDIIVVAERDTILTSRKLVQQTGWLLGASSGSVMAAICRYAERFRSGDVVIGIAADSGERYLDGLYNDDWVSTHFPDLLPCVAAL